MEPKRIGWFVMIRALWFHRKTALLANDERELYEFSLYTIHELHTNHELRITKSRIANTRIVWRQPDMVTGHINK